jgi:hypothetical protein
MNIPSINRIILRHALRTYTQEPYPCTRNVTRDEQVRDNWVQQENPSPNIECVMSIVREKKRMMNSRKRPGVGDPFNITNTGTYVKNLIDSPMATEMATCTMMRLSGIDLKSHNMHLQ